jgi:hypothetical protein
MKRAVPGICVAVALMAGCGKEEKAAPKQQGGGVEVNAPGVNIKADEKGAEVTIPGGGVKVKQ